VRFAVFHVTNIGFAYGQLGDFETALDELTRGRQDAARFGLHQAIRVLDQNRGHVMMCLGRFEEARDLELSVLHDAQKQAPRIFAIAHACLARIQVRMGLKAEAIASAQIALDASPTDVPRIYSLACLAEAELACGIVERALDAATRALGLAIKLGGTAVGDVIAGRVAVEALLMLGRRDEARRVLEVPLALVRARVELVRNPVWRKTTVERVEEHRRILELARDLEIAVAEA
jgi:tetratricopeptide (TPR) repeat protein